MISRRDFGRSSIALAGSMAMGAGAMNAIGGDDLPGYPVVFLSKGDSLYIAVTTGGDTGSDRAAAERCKADIKKAFSLAGRRPWKFVGCTWDDPSQEEPTKHYPMVFLAASLSSSQQQSILQSLTVPFGWAESVESFANAAVVNTEHDRKEIVALIVDAIVRKA